MLRMFGTYIRQGSVKTKLRLTVTQLHAALQRLWNEYAPAAEHPGSTVKHRSKKLSDIEAILHELAHALCLGDPHCAENIEAFLPKDPAEQNAHELTALRVEFAVLDMLGFGVPKQKQCRMLKTASFWEEPPAPSETDLCKPITCAENALATIAVGLIARAHHELKQREWTL